MQSIVLIIFIFFGNFLHPITTNVIDDLQVTPLQIETTRNIREHVSILSFRYFDGSYYSIQDSLLERNGHVPRDNETRIIRYDSLLNTIWDKNLSDPFGFRTRSSENPNPNIPKILDLNSDKIAIANAELQYELNLNSSSSTASAHQDIQIVSPQDGNLVKELTIRHDFPIFNDSEEVGIELKYQNGFLISNHLLIGYSLELHGDSTNPLIRFQTSVEFGLIDLNLSTGNYNIFPIETSHRIGEILDIFEVTGVNLGFAESNLEENSMHVSALVKFTDEKKGIQNHTLQQTRINYYVHDLETSSLKDDPGKETIDTRCTAVSVGDPKNCRMHPLYPVNYDQVIESMIESNPLVYRLITNNETIKEWNLPRQKRLVRHSPEFAFTDQTIVISARFEDGNRPMIVFMDHRETNSTSLFIDDLVSPFDEDLRLINPVFREVHRRHSLFMTMTNQVSLLIHSELQNLSASFQDPVEENSWTIIKLNLPLLLFRSEIATIFRFFLPSFILVTLGLTFYRISQRWGEADDLGGKQYPKHDKTTD